MVSNGSTAFPSLFDILLPFLSSTSPFEIIFLNETVSELKEQIDKSVEAGFMKENPVAEYKNGDFSKENYSSFDLHRPFVDNIFLVSESGKKMFREPDLIDGWFDSGSMPYAQHHYPFSMKDPAFKNYYPADFIAEGVDQTRGWFL
ncbi:unnamed protein product, partial [marine sediment metagenome]